MNTSKDTVSGHAVADQTLSLQQLKWLVHRYETVVGVFAHSLSDEFLPSDKAIEDWTDNLSLLREAAFPIANHLSKNPSLGSKYKQFLSLIHI